MNAHQAQHRGRRRRILLLSLSFLAAAALFLVATYQIERHGQLQEIEAAVAEARAIDPILTIAELEALREAIPEAENSAPRIQAAADLATYQMDQPLIRYLGDATPNEVPPASVAEALQAVLSQAAPALEKMRGLETLPRGRHAVERSRDYSSTSNEHAFRTLSIVQLLECQAAHLSANEQIEGALTICRAALNTGRSISDEANLTSQLTRKGCLGKTLTILQRILAHGVASADSLAALQRELTVEEAVPVLWIAIRAERAGYHGVFQAVEAGELSLGKLTEEDLNSLDEVMGRRLMREGHPAYLRFMNQLLGISRQPPERRLAGLNALWQGLPQPPVMAAVFISPLRGTCFAFQDRDARLRLAIAALACERYRLAHDRWPASLVQLVPDYLPAVPLDPYDAQPLRLRRLSDGVQLYSIGFDQKDDGGKVVGASNIGVDIGFRLWDVDRRRQSAGSP
jgi:hypothetical protein